jgi:hypothetical protein
MRLYVEGSRILHFVRAAERALLDLETGRRVRPSRGRTLRAIRRFARSLPRNAGDLLRLHEALLFHAAYPESAPVRRAALALLDRIPLRVRELARRGSDLSALNEPETAGLGGTEIGTTFSYDFLRFLVPRHARSVRIDWDEFEGDDRLGATLPRFLPLLEEEALADANVPYRSWIDAGRGRRPELPWLLERFEALPLEPRARAELFDGIGLPVAWELSDRASRSGARLVAPRPFLHRGPLLARRDVDVAAVLAAPRLRLERMSEREARRRLDLARETLATRYRELYGFTYGDPATARVVRDARGFELSLFGAPPGRRLPLRASYAAFVLKNGIPVAYVEALALFERVEVGFNVFYTFREGESAWIYAQVMKLFQDALGTTSFSVDPYQIGYENEEAIESGAFWFYRKLGFRSTAPELRAATEEEEAKLAANPGRRTPARVLRRFARRNMLYEEGRGAASGEWDRFHVRNVPLAVDRRMARDFGGDSEAIRKSSVRRVGRRLGVDLESWKGEARRSAESLALVLDLVEDLGRWSAGEKALAVRILRAKSAREETGYLALLRRHRRLRSEILRIGSAGPP